LPTNRSGGLIGGQIGYRWQASQWVFGLEAQGDWADLNNQRVSIVNPALSIRTKTSAIGLFTGQIGYAWNASLFYFKGGAAVTDNRLSIIENVFGTELVGQSATRWGAPWGLDGSMASHRTGLPALNTTTYSWAMPTIRSRLPM
jgi:outer membrane immunogenic protein